MWAWSRISPRPSGCALVFLCCSGCLRGACAADRQAVDRLADWTGAAAASGVLAQLEDIASQALEFRRNLEMLESDVERLRGSV